MTPSQIIREAVADVQRLREQGRALPGIGGAVATLKRFQARRFAATYADLLHSRDEGRAVRFFLDELYGERDYAQRDAQFARIAGAVERLFPRDVGETAASLARLHALTESLDHELALAAPLRDSDDIRGYVRAWKTVGRAGDRKRQLDAVLSIGAEMTRLTRLPGLRMMLRMMRGPASAAGLSPLQAFLESGFDAFSAMAGVRGRAEFFLTTLREREQGLMDLLRDAAPVACETELSAILGQAR